MKLSIAHSTKCDYRINLNYSRINLNYTLYTGHHTCHLLFCSLVQKWHQSHQGVHCDHFSDCFCDYVSINSDFLQEMWDQRKSMLHQRPFVLLSPLNQTFVCTGKSFPDTKINSNAFFTIELRYILKYVFNDAEYGKRSEVPHQVKHTKVVIDSSRFCFYLSN